ncbi:hypothetical protein GE21DRAFT_1214646 [Neurospora crassa]|nr:hypothetical protein GE21DRAFT_1214646 [Neurospora crassa]
MRQSVHNNQCRVSQPPEESPGLNRVKLQEFKSDEGEQGPVPYCTVIGQLHSRMLDLSLAVDISLALPYSGAVQIFHLPERDLSTGGRVGCIKMDPQPNCMAAPHPGTVGTTGKMKLRRCDECVMRGYSTSVR